MGEAELVMVTGGAGFAGGYVVRELVDNGYTVVLFDSADFRPETRHVIGERVTDVLIEKGSVENFPRVLEVVQRHRPQSILHLGANMDLGFLDRNPMVALRVNVEGTLNILEAARLFGVKSTVITSSIGVIGRRLYEPIDANHPTITAYTGPLGGYGASKLAAEAFAFAYRRSFGLNVRVIRPSAIYGFGMSWFAPNYMKQIVEPAVQGQPVRVAKGGDMPRDYIHAADLASLFLKVMNAPEEADVIFYGATGQALRTAKEVGRIVADQIAGADIEIGSGLSESDREELVMRGVLCIANAQEQLGWRPHFEMLEDGVQEYICRLREYLAIGGCLTLQPVLEKAPGS